MFMDRGCNRMADVADFSYSDDGYRLRLIPKKLSSGKCQVKFYARMPERKEMYGYVLTNADDTLKGVVAEIITRLKIIRRTSDYKHINLFSIGKSNTLDNIIIFDS